MSTTGEDSGSNSAYFLKEPPDISLEEIFDLNRGAASRLTATLAQNALRGLFRICFRLEVENIDRLPQRGPFLLCPNHQSYVDPFWIYSILPPHILERMLFVADRAHFELPVLSWMNRFGRLILTGKKGKLPECLRFAYEGLRRGMAVCIFPEGARTNTGKVMRPRRGMKILSEQTGVPVVPVLIRGGENVLSNFHPGFRFCKISLTIGFPIYANEGDILETWRKTILRMQEAKECGVSPERSIMEATSHV